MNEGKGLSHDQRWRMSYDQLVQLLSRDINKPLILDRQNAGEKKLAYWVKTQRRKFRELKMENERKELLNNIGFAWEHTDRYHVNKLPDFERIENIKLKKN